MPRPAPKCPRLWSALRRYLVIALACGTAFASLPARAAVSEPDGRPDDAFDLMNLLAARGWHDLANERWNLYGQFTWISSFKRPFAAPYTNWNGSNKSLRAEAEHSFTGSATLYVGLRLWPGGEVYLVPEVISSRPLSNLGGLGGAIQNFELQKTGSEVPSVYLSRAYLRQNIDLGGAPVVKASDPMQLGTAVTARRLVLTLGNFSVLDFMDKNAYSGDLRRQFINMAFLTHSAYDFAADARGYAWGAVAELIWDDWTLRVARMTPPALPNQLDIDFRLTTVYGDQLELEHVHRLGGRPGAVHVLGYRNVEHIGRFDTAVAAWRADPKRNAASCVGFDYDSANATAPDLCWARKMGSKMGIGLNLEQEIDDDVGVFLRTMYSDGNSEVYSYTSTDRSLSLGLLAKGKRWHRSADMAGVGVGSGWISSAHAEFLSLGGVDGFVGDGRITAASERVLEAFYSVNLTATLWLTGDYQHISNPGFNADRGPVDIFGVRAHGEF